MTPEQIAAIAARNAARTPGKWQAVALGNDDYPSEVWFADNMRVCLMPSNTGQRKPKDADFIAHASEDIPALLAEVKRLTAVIEHDRSKVVDVLAEANAVLKNYGWLAEGRGSYAFDDDRWKDEFKVCMDSLAKVLDPMRGIASDLSDSPIKWADIVAARSMTDALAEAEKRSDRAVAYIKAIAAVAKLQPTAQECGIKPDLILPETWEDLGRFLGYLSETVRVMVRP